MIQTFLLFKKPLAPLLTFSIFLGAVQPTPAWAKPSFGKVEAIDVVDTDRMTVVTIRGQRLGTPQPITMQDAKTRLAPKLFIVIYDTLLDSSVEGNRPGKGAIVGLHATAVAIKPHPISQVVLDLAGDLTTRVKKNGAIVIEVDKKPGTAKADPRSEAKVPAAADVKRVLPTADMAPARADQVIQAGDSLFLAVSPAEELSRDLVVDQNGRISLPLLGAVPAAGMTADQLSRKLQADLSRYVEQPKVDILVKQSAGKQVAVTGQINAPGSYPYRSNMRLLDLISVAGGFLPNANRKMVRVLRRHGQERRAIPANTDEIAASGDASRDIALEPGDIVDVPRGANGVTVFGQVEKPGTYDFVYDMRMLDLVSLCHGFRDGANLKHIVIIRGEPPNQTAMRVRFSSVLRNRPQANIALRPGDIVYVPQKSLWSASTLATTLTPIATLVLAGATVALATR